MRDPSLATFAIEELSWAVRAESHSDVQVAAIAALLEAATSQPEPDSAVTLSLESLLISDASSCPLVLSAALTALRDFSRRYPGASPPIETATVSFLSRERQLSAEGEAALLWFLGKWPDSFPTALGLFQFRADNWQALESHVKLEVLSSVVNCFIARPREFLPVISVVFAAAIEDTDLDVADMCKYYCGIARAGGIDKLRAVGEAVAVACEPSLVRSIDHLATSFNTLVSK